MFRWCFNESVRKVRNAVYVQWLMEVETNRRTIFERTQCNLAHAYTKCRVNYVDRWDDMRKKFAQCDFFITNNDGDTSDQQP